MYRPPGLNERLEEKDENVERAKIEVQWLEYKGMES